MLKKSNIKDFNSLQVQNNHSFNSVFNSIDDISVSLISGTTINSYFGSRSLSDDEFNSFILLARELLIFTLPGELKISTTIHPCFYKDKVGKCGCFAAVEYEDNVNLETVIGFNTSSENKLIMGGASVIETIFHEFRHYYQACLKVDGSLVEPNQNKMDRSILSETAKSLRGDMKKSNHQDDYFFDPTEIDAVAYSHHILYCLYGVQAPYGYIGKKYKDYVEAIKKRRLTLEKRYPEDKIRQIAANYELPDLCGFKQIKE